MNAGFATDRTFFTPAFRIELEGRDAGRAVVADVLEVSFTDDLAAIDSFEFTLRDWDPVARHPRYSSPWDGDGRPFRLYAEGPEVPNFEPGAQVSLYLGYLEDGNLPLAMKGEVVSLSPSFPAGGSPTCRVRALDAFLRGLQKTEVEGNYSGTDREIVDRLCAEQNVTVRWSHPESEGSPKNKVEVEGTLYNAIDERVKAYGLSLTTREPEAPGGDPVLYLAEPAEGDVEPVVAFEWGKTLISFTPTLSAAGQISQVVVRAGDPAAEGADRSIEVVRSWSDIGLSPTALGPAAAADLQKAVRGVREIIKPDGVTTREDAEQAADAHLRELAKQLITGSGTSVGLPQLRAGRAVTMTGLGARFDGFYRLVKTTHTLGGSGYTTTFDARKEVLLT